MKNNGKHHRDTEQIILVHNVNRKINTVTFYYCVRAYHRPSTILTAVVQNSGETSTPRMTNQNLRLPPHIPHIGRCQSSVTLPRRPLAAIPFSRACLFPLGVFIPSDVVGV